MPAAALNRPKPHPWRARLALAAVVLFTSAVTPLRANTFSVNTDGRTTHFNLGGGPVVCLWIDADNVPPGEVVPTIFGQGFMRMKCTSTNPITGQVRVQNCITDRDRDTTECVDEPKP